MPALNFNSRYAFEFSKKSEFKYLLLCLVVNSEASNEWGSKRTFFYRRVEGNPPSLHKVSTYLQHS